MVDTIFIDSRHGLYLLEFFYFYYTGSATIMMQHEIINMNSFNLVNYHYNE